MRDPRTVHDFEQFNAGIRDMAQAVVAYRKDLIAGGVDENEAWAAAQRIESRYFDILTAKLEAKRKGEDQALLERAIALLDEMIERRALISDDEHE